MEYQPLDKVVIHEETKSINVDVVSCAGHWPMGRKMGNRYFCLATWKIHCELGPQNSSLVQDNIKGQIHVKLRKTISVMKTKRM